MKDDTAKENPGHLIAQTKNPKMILDLGTITNISASSAQQVIDVTELSDSFESFLPIPVEQSFYVDLEVSQLQLQYLINIFENQDVVLFSFFVHEAYCDFDGIISKYSKEVLLKDYYLLHCVISLCGGVYFHIDDDNKPQDINTMSIYEIMEHVHKRLTQLDKRKKS